MKPIRVVAAAIILALASSVTGCEVTRSPNRPDTEERRPEADPCIPCEGDLGGGNLDVDLSGSDPQPAGVEIVGVELEVSGIASPLNLSAGVLALLTSADIPSLVISGRNSLTPANDPVLHFAIEFPDGTSTIVSRSISFPDMRAPVVNPCLPCVGSHSSLSLDVDLSLSEPQPPGGEIVGVSFEVNGGGMTAVSLPPTVLAALSAGELPTLVVPATQPVGPADQPVLHFEIVGPGGASGMVSRSVQFSGP